MVITPNSKSFLLVQALIGGLLAGLSLSHGGVVLSFFALSLLWAVSNAPLAAGLWGGVAVLVSHRWMLSLHPLDWIGIPSSLSFPLTVFLWFSCGVIASVLIILWVLVGKCLPFKNLQDGGTREEKVSYAVFMSCLWGLSEVVLARLPLFWVGLGVNLVPYDNALAGLARWIGSGGLAAVELLIGWWLWRITIVWRKGVGFKKPFWIGVLFILIGHGIGWRLLALPMPTSSMSVAIWQTNLPTREKFSSEQQLNLPRKVQDALTRANQVEASLLIAPEGTLPAGQELLHPAPVSFFTGGFRWVLGRQRSSILFVDEGERDASIFVDKHRLVPLGEWVPTFWGLNKKGLSALGGLEAGLPSRLLEWQGPSSAVAICYELSNGFGIAKAVHEGAEWIMALANLDPYPLLLQKQYLALAQLRGIETGRDVLTVANTGPSGVVMADGKIDFILKPFTETVELASLNFYQFRTGYILWRELPLLFAMIIGGVCFSSSRYRK